MGTLMYFDDRNTATAGIDYGDTSDRTQIIVVRGPYGDTSFLADELTRIATRVFEGAKRFVQDVADAFERATPALRKAMEAIRALGRPDVRPGRARPAPVPPGPPPVPLALCAAPWAPPRVLPSQGALAPRPMARRHARQAVPARTRRRVRVWER